MNLPSIKRTPTPPPLPPPNPTPTAVAAAARGVNCTNCNITDRWVLHRLLFRGTDRNLCTSCVLRLHPSSFCPTCLEFFDHSLSSTSPSPSSSAHRFISCTKCPSLTHLRCLPPSSPPPSSFLCPSCSNPSFKFFNPDNARHVLDKKNSRVALCAAKIASASGAKVLNIARVRADRTAREAASARKRAKDALERIAKLQRVEGSGVDVSGSRNFAATNNGVAANNNRREEMNGENRVRVSSVAMPSQVQVQVPRSMAVNNNGVAPHSAVRGNGNVNVNVNANGVVRDNRVNGEDSERVKNNGNGNLNPLGVQFYVRVYASAYPTVRFTCSWPYTK
ncbi:hypothetical protein RIF29_22202 [Crotalaria pallida]|uniref:PHD-type domain-containing protein n=1 Tax=Crotalaria pallida TaxID=3830 RepID=A0AAN9F8W6_CROPI